MTCNVCKRQFNDAREDLYKDALSVIRDNKHFKKLPIVLVERIVKTAYPDSVTITWERKTRCHCNVCMNWPPSECIEYTSSDSEYSEESGEDNDYCENDGYLYYTCRAVICHKCFLEGIERVMRNNDSLPFLRFHSNAFFNRIPVEIDPYKYIIPSRYNITFYRRKYPVKTEEGYYIITPS
jgi:hypothetical protein